MAGIGGNLPFRNGPHDPFSNLLGVKFVGHVAGKDDLAVRVVAPVGEELTDDRLVHLLGEVVGDGSLHTEEQ